MDKKMKYELVDPREGDNGVKYSYENERDMRAKADELGATRYQGVKPDNERVQFVRSARNGATKARSSKRKRPNAW